MITYVIKIRTGDLDCAGTDANVYINIKGSEGFLKIFKKSRI